MSAANFVGRRFGRLVVNARAENTKSNKTTWHCSCDCGSTTTVRQDHLASGRVLACGCLLERRRAEAHVTHGHSRGDSPVRSEFGIWEKMVRRCHNPKDAGYRFYGAKGVAVCAEWRDGFDAFIAHVGPRPTPKHSIDRHPDPFGNYEPGNCRWATRKQQAENTRKKYIERGGPSL